MSFRRLPLALALSITLIGGGLTCAAPAVARPLLESQTSCSAYDAEGGKVLLIAAKDSGAESNDKNSGSSTKNKSDKSAKKSKGAAKDEAKDDKDKAAAEEKGGKNKKAVKEEKARADKAAVLNDESEKKKAKGMFFHRKNAEEEKTATEGAAPAQVKAKKESAEEENAGKKKEEAKAPPAFVPDESLISVLKDISKSLADTGNEQVAKVENENEKVILGLSEEILAKALTAPDLPSNRIVPRDEEHQIKNALTAESWSSGDVVVNEKLRGSLAAVWAKRVGGLLTLTIAGDAGQRKTPDGNPIGEFMVVVTAHSPVQSGFDIQSQGDVTFWMGKLAGINIEANCVSTADPADKAQTTSSSDTTSPPAAEAKKKLTTFISPLLTNRYRKYELLLAADRQTKRAEAKMDEEGGPAKETAAAGDDGKAAPQEAASKETASKENGENKGGAAKSGNGSSDKTQLAMASTAGDTTIGTAAAAAAPIVDAGPHFNLPGVNATLLMPERALAGQYVTVALLGRGRQPEPNVELSFNGASLATDASGQAIYQIPDDINPGRTLNVALSARPEEVPATVEVLQPLGATSGQPPRIDRMTPLAVKDSIMTIDGHNFDGLAANNKVIVDGSLEAKIVSASPFQLRLLLPTDVQPGAHSLCVSTDGTRSNLGGFDFAGTLVTVDGKDTGKENSVVKVLVKVIGTTAKMNVKILNQTPDIIRLNRGAELTLTSSGGFDNSILLTAIRAKKGQFNIDTQIEM